MPDHGSRQEAGAVHDSEADALHLRRGRASRLGRPHRSGSADAVGHVGRRSLQAARGRRRGRRLNREGQTDPEPRAFPDPSVPRTAETHARRPEKAAAALPGETIVSGRADNGFPGWEVYVPQFVHPVKVAIVEALLCIGGPLSAAQFTNLFSGEGDSFRESNLRYHLRRLVKVGVLEVARSSPFGDGVKVDKFFYFADRDSRDGPSCKPDRERSASELYWSHCHLFRFSSQKHPQIN
jgi:hypothetical protein